MSGGEGVPRAGEGIPRFVIPAVGFGAGFYRVLVRGGGVGGRDERGRAAALWGPGGPAGGPPRSPVRFGAGRTRRAGALAHTYVGQTMADLLDVAAVLSSLGAALVGVAVASRTLFALARDHLLDDRIAAVSPRSGTPSGGVAASMILTLALLLGFGLGGTSALDAFFYLATIGTLSLLVLYTLVSVSALRLELTQRDRRSWIGIIVPIAGAGVALYVLYRNL